MERLQQLRHRQENATPREDNQKGPVPRLYRKWDLGEDKWSLEESLVD